MNSEPERAAHDSYAALRFRDFRLLLSGRFLASLGDQMVSVAVFWQIYEWTNSTFALGMVGLAEVLPVILLSLFAGHVADNGNRRRIVLTMKFMLAFCSLALGALSLWRIPAAQPALFAGGLHSFLHTPQSLRVVLLYGIILLIGAARAFLSPAGSTLLPVTVPQAHYTNAVTWNSNAWQLASAIGPAVGGGLIALSGSATPVYFLDFGLGLAYIALISAIRGRQVLRDKKAAAAASQEGAAFLRLLRTWVMAMRETRDSLREGLAFLRQSRLLLATITLDLFAVLLGGATALLPVYAKDILKVGPVGLGWLRAAPSVGAVVIALSLAHLPPMKQAGRTLIWAVLGFGAATIVFGFSRSFPLSLLMLFLLGAFDNVSVVIRSTLLLLRVPDAMRGRISAVNSIFVGASNELGAFESGVVASVFGPVAAVVSGGAGTIFVVLLIALLWPELRGLTTLQNIDDAPI